MKRFLPILLFVVAAFTGCYEDSVGPEEPVFTPITFSESSVTVSENGGTCSVTVMSDYYWTASTSDSWITVTTTSGYAGESPLRFRVDSNPNATERTGKILVKCDDYNISAELIVEQMASSSSVFTITINNKTLTCGYVDYAISATNPDMLYLAVSSQDLSQYGVQGETPAELMTNYLNLLTQYFIIFSEDNTWAPDNWFTYKGNMADVDVWKQATRFSAEESVQIYAVGINITATDSDSSGYYATAAELATAVHAWEAPFLPYPTLTVPEAQLVNNVTSAAGELILDCVLTNSQTDGSEVTLSTEATWVHPTWADNKLTIAYDANETAVARRAKIAVQYGWWTNPFEVTVIQEKNADATAITLNITVKETHFNSIVVDIDSSDDNAWYALKTLAHWETGAPQEVDWVTEVENIIGYAGNTQFLQGDKTGYVIKMNPSNYEWCGYDYYVFGFAVAMNEDNTAATAQIGEVASVLTKIDTSDMPVLTWDVEKSGLVWNENAERYDIEVVEGSTVVLYFNVENPVEGATVKTTGATFYDSYNVVDGEPVIDNAAGTVTFKIDKFDTAKNYHYVNVLFKYTNADDDMWGITTPTVRLTQKENPGMALPYEESFENGIGNFTINDVFLGEGLSYVWKHESGTYGYYMKASAYAGSAKESESWLVSPKIDLSAATMPGLQFSHTHKYAGTPAEELTLWVKEYGAADWTQVTIPTYGTNNDWTFVTAAVDLSAWAGKKVQIGFKYTSSASAAATWEVKDVVVYDAGGVAM